MDLRDFFTFRKMVSKQIVEISYIVGLVIITIGGIITLFNEFLIGLAIIFLGNLLWRLICESAILLFSIHDILGSIEANKENNNYL